MRRRSLHAAAGVSLIEALVALAVMAFGILGVAGVQATLRANGDFSKQRSEAVRLAQQAIEQARTFTVLTSPGGASPPPAYGDIISTAQPIEITSPLYNTTFLLQRQVSAAPVGNARTLVVTVSWTDRTGQTPFVSLSTNIAGIAPELGGTLMLAGDVAAAQQGQSRNPAIPQGAVDQGNGTSTFAPPGGPDKLLWVFNNVSGVITSICNPTCTASNAYLLSGFVRYATGGNPTPQDGEIPSSTAFELVANVSVTAPTVQVVPCFQAVAQSYAYLSYYCAIPLGASDTSWSGRSTLAPPVGAPWNFSSSLADPLVTNFKVCRYTPVQSDTPPGGNADHPLDYSDVKGPLANQNFLIIRAGDGTTAYSCPADDTSPSSPINTNTWRHQPLL